MDLEIDVSGGLASVGDLKSVSGVAAVLLRDGYDLVFLPGNGINWSLDMRRIEGAVEVNITVGGRVELTCYRCLKKFDFSLDIKTREHALWLEEGKEKPGDEAMDEYVVTGESLDLTPILRDAICLGLPSRRVCEEKCRGLCPVCGADLNLEQCGCDTGPTDARLKPLADLKKRLEENG